ncbi:hypothetical protein [Streptomyces sp. YIM S03343]
MNHRTTTLALACCALTLTTALTGCSAPPSPAAQPGTKPTPSSHAPSTRAPGASPEATGSAAAGAREHPQAADSGLPPKPGSDGEAAYVRALTAIDPDIVHDDEAGAVDRGRAQCRTIHDLHGDRNGQITAAVRRFTSPGHPQGFGTAKGARIVDAVHMNLCPDF